MQVQAHVSQVVWALEPWVLEPPGLPEEPMPEQRSGPLQRREQAQHPEPTPVPELHPAWAAHLGVAGRPEALDVRPVRHPSLGEWEPRACRSHRRVQRRR